jgi:hypothetical protein
MEKRWHSLKENGGMLTGSALGGKLLEQHVGFKVFMAVAMKNVVFWYIKAQFIPHRRHITSSLRSPAG